MATVNVYSAEREWDDGDPDGYRAGAAAVGRLAGGSDTTVRVYELPAGQSVCPYHYEYEEEWLLVMLRRKDGAVDYWDGEA